MENDLEGSESATLPEVRLVLIGRRWSGKSVSGNTILGKDRFECGRTRTTQTEVRHAAVQGRRLVVVDVPGWSRSLSLTEIPEGDKRRFKLSASRCPPGPHVFLLVVPVDSAFSAESKRTVEEHMKLLGERVWRHTVVLFTCGDFLGGKTIEQHIESEGESLRWLTERCRNRYHVFNNKDRRDGGQVTRLLQEVDELTRDNGGRCYQVDEQTLSAIEEKQREVAERAEVRRGRAQEQRSLMRTLIPEEMQTLPELRVVLLGSRSVGKTSLGNSILGSKEQEDGKRTARSVARRGFAGSTAMTVVDTPGWWKGFSVLDTPEATREEVISSPFLCLPGPHVFLLAIDADASFNANHLDAVTTHVELLGEGVWRRTVVVFTRGDWLGSHTAEEYIEGEGEALRSLVDRCGNRYHVIDNKNADDGTQITELLEKITETVAGNGGDYFVPDGKIFLTIEERRSSVVEAASVRKSQVVAKRKILRDNSQELPELTIVMLGQKTFGKSATGNNLLRREVFATCENESCQMETGKVAGRLVTVIDTPGWRKTPFYCKDREREIVRGLSLSPAGVHAVLLVVPLDLTFGEAQRAALEERLNLFDAGVWKHAVVLFTYGDNLADESVEEHIEREHGALRWLIDKCEDKYHVVNNAKKMDPGQAIELFEKIEEMVAGNDGRLFCPEMDDVYLRIEENFGRRQLKLVLKQRLGEEYKRRELELMAGFRDTLLELQEEVKGSKRSTRAMTLTKGIGFKKKDGKEREDILSLKIKEEIEKLDKDIEMKSSTLLLSSMEFFIPDLKGEGPGPSVAGSLPQREGPTSHFDNVLGWLSTLKIGRNFDNQMTLNFSQTSGYRSVVPYDDLDSEVEEYS